PDPVELGTRDADPVVPYGEDRPDVATTLLLADADRDVAATGAVLDRVRHQVRDDPLDPGLVPVAEQARKLGLELDRVARADLLVLTGQPAGDLHEVGRSV